MDTSGSLPHGIPTCQQWWEDASHGLRQRLLEDNSRTQRVVTWVQSRFPGMTVEERQDTLARNILEQAPHPRPTRPGLVKKCPICSVAFAPQAQQTFFQELSTTLSTDSVDTLTANAKGPYPKGLRASAALDWLQSEAKKDLR